MRSEFSARTLLAMFLAIFLVSALFSGQPSAAAQAQQPANPQTGAQAIANFGNVPLTFEANRGQTGAQVKFLSRGQGYTAFLTAGGIVLSLRPGQPLPAQPASNIAAPNQSQPVNATLQFQLQGAAQNPAVIGENQQPGIANYFTGNDSTKWLTNVPTYAQVRYKNVYPGIDLVYYGNHRQLEYDFAISPGADPRKIQFQITGANQIELDAQGNLVLQTSGGILRFQTPSIYQESNGLRVPVSGTYVVNDPTHISFHVARYDVNKPLVIDPVLLYGTYVGGTGSEQASGIAVDSTGAVYIAGYTNSASFSTTTLGSPAISMNHVFVVKLNATGSGLAYADYLGGSSNDYAIALALDSSNNVYVTGSTESSNFPTVGAYQSSRPGPYTGFVSKIAAGGASLAYSTYLGGSGFDEPASIAVDSAGEAFVAGMTTSQNYPMVNAYQASAPANQGSTFGDYGFLTKLAAAGSTLSYSTYLAGNTTVAQGCGTCWPEPISEISAVAVDADDDAYVAGTTNTSNFPTTEGAYLTSNSPQANSTIGFVSKFTSAGSSLDYSTYFYGSSGNPVTVSAIAVDSSDSAYITGSVASDSTFPVTSGAICTPSASGAECSYAFVTKFNSGATELSYSTFLGLNNDANPQSIAIDSSNNAYVVANTNSGAFEISDGIEGYSGNQDLLLVEVNVSGTSQVFATYLGASGSDSANGIALDASGNIYVVGSTTSTDFPTTQGAFQNVEGGGSDTFVVKIGPSSAPAVALAPNALAYSTQSVGTESAAQSVLVRNMGSSALTISSVAASGDFAQTNTCGTSLAAASTCTFAVTFTPTTGGTRSGSITMQDDAAGSPHIINLSGSANGPGITLSPTSLTFSVQQIGTSSATQAVTLTNSGNQSMTVGVIQTSGAYTQTNNCPTSLAATLSCTVSVTFSPTVGGVLTGTLTINDNAYGSPQAENLSGTGADFSLASTPASNSVQPGSTATYQLAISPVGGSFPNAIALSCTGAPAETTCSISPSSVTPNGSAVAATVTITTTGSVSQNDVPPNAPPSHRMYAVWLQLQGVGLLGMVLTISQSRSRKSRVTILLVLLMMASLCMVGCAGGTGIASQGQTGTAPGTYPITITGTSGALQHTLPLTVIVQ